MESTETLPPMASQQMTLTARKVPTNDPILFKYAEPDEIDTAGVHRDVLIAKPNGETVARIPWHYKSKPDRRNRYITLNCYCYRLKWLD